MTFYNAVKNYTFFTQHQFSEIGGPTKIFYCRPVSAALNISNVSMLPKQFISGGHLLLLLAACKGGCRINPTRRHRMGL